MKRLEARPASTERERVPLSKLKFGDTCQFPEDDADKMLSYPMAHTYMVYKSPTQLKENRVSLVSLDGSLSIERDADRTVYLQEAEVYFQPCK